MDRREDQRAPITLPIEIKTPQGEIKGNTANISVSGLTLLLFLEKPEIDDKFEVTIGLSDDRKTPVTCEKIWAASTMGTDKTVYTAIGVQFTKISARDQKIIAGLVEEYCME